MKQNFSNDFSCQVRDCNFFATSGKTLLSHYRRIHQNDSAFESKCLYQSKCSDSEKFRTVSNLIKHLKRRHVEFFSEVTLLPQNSENFQFLAAPGPSSAVIVDTYVEDFSGFDSFETESSSANHLLEPSSVSAAGQEEALHVKSKAAVFLLNLLEDRKLTQADAKFVIEETEDLLNSAIFETLSRVSTSLNVQGCNHNDLLKTIGPAFSSGIFENLKTQHSRAKFFKEAFGMVPPTRLYLPLLASQFGHNLPKRQSYVYVPVLQVLEKLLNKPDLYAAVMTAKPRVQGRFRYFEDGSEYATNPFFLQHPQSLQIHLYLDEVEMCNPLGSKTKIHKLVFVYLAVGNIDPKHRSSLSQIHLVSIFYNKQVLQYGINKLLEPIVDDLQKLEDGVELCIDGTYQTIFGTLTAFSADNLASHAVGGFKIGFSKTLRPCRTCLVTRDDMQEIFCDRELPARTKEEHDLQCEGLNTESDKHFASLYGIQFPSVLNRLKHFHVIGGMVPDTLHDVLEGSLPLTLCELLLHCVKKKKYFRLEQLNHMIQSFQYGSAEVRDKPSLIDRVHLEKRKLRQSAAQIWQLGVLLPLLVGKFVPKIDPAWHCFTTLLEICQIIFKDTTSTEELLIVDSLINEYLTSFKECFGRNIIPKQHYMIHFSRTVHRMGPLGLYWCMRYEGKHSYFKQLVQSIGQFKNLPWTLSLRHQQWQCRNLKLKQNFLAPDCHKPKNPTWRRISTLPNGGQIASFFGHTMADVVNVLTWLKIGSSLFRPNESLLLCPLNGNREVQFGLLLGIYESNNVHAFWCEMFETVHFDTHLQAFKVRNRRDRLQLILAPSDLIDYRIYHLHNKTEIFNSCYSKNVQSSFYVISKVRNQLHPEL